MDCVVKLFVRAAWQWATALFAMVLCTRPAWPAPVRAPVAPAVTSATGRLATVTEQYVTDTGVGSTPGIELVAIGRSPDGRIQVARARLPGQVRREASPHRIVRVPGEAARWEACWRILRHDHRGASAIGCIRREVRGNNHPDVRHPPDGQLLSAWSFDLAAQTFRVEDAPEADLPVPREWPAGRPWSGRRFYFPLPLTRTTPAVAKRLLRSRGADISPTSESAQVLVLPDRTDVCAFDRASRPTVILPALRRGVPVLWERNLDAFMRAAPQP